ncbi:MAG TPA: Uma2 family endonuclease [Nostocaceae cyanobacterium]|nr:Uma2 family endonuclease [Nostocaceae cyanobacterium]
MVLQTDKELTLEEFLKLPINEGDINYELIDGQAVPKMSPQKRHSKLTRAFIKIFELCYDDKCEIYPELSVKLTRKGRDWIPTPDLLYIVAEHLPEDWEEEGICNIIPDLVIEIISPSQSFGKMAEKAQDYLAAKVPRVWVVDIEDRSITIFYPDAPPQTYRGDELITDVLFPRLEFTVEQLFKNAKIPLN